MASRWAGPHREEPRCAGGGEPPRGGPSGGFLRRGPGEASLPSAAHGQARPTAARARDEVIGPGAAPQGAPVLRPSPTDAPPSLPRELSPTSCSLRCAALFLHSGFGSAETQKRSGRGECARLGGSPELESRRHHYCFIQQTCMERLL